MCSLSSACDTTRPRWCIRYDSTRNSWLVSRTGAPSQRHARRTRIERDRAAAELAGELSAGAADERAQPRQDFFHPERLGDVVVGAAVDALDLLVPAAARRQDEHRQRQAGVAPAAQQREPVDLRQAEIEHDRVVALGLAEEVGALAVAGAVHGVAGVRQGARQLLRQPGFVFDDQDLHRISLPSFRLKAEATRCFYPTRS